MVTDEPFHKDTFNSSVMIVKPNMDDYNALLNLVEKYDYYNIGKIGDQNIINEFVKDKCVITLDKEYNCMRTISYEVTKDVKDPVIIHYIGQPKPFMIDDYKDEYSNIYKDYLNKVRDKIKELD
jgi:lipopolysaccharide biosynthesis glycosyltransferase